METQASEPQVFERILAGVDGTPPSLIAVRQALRRRPSSGFGSGVRSDDVTFGRDSHGRRAGT